MNGNVGLLGRLEDFSAAVRIPEGSIMCRYPPGCTVFMLVSLYFGAAAQAQTIWHVDDDAWMGGDGLTWQTAYKHLQDALAVAAYGDEIRVAGGTYMPDQDEAELLAAGVARVFHPGAAREVITAAVAELAAAAQHSHPLFAEPPAADQEKAKS